MNSRSSPIRAPGQRSIASTFLFRASNQSADCNKNVEIKAAPKNGPHLSLSDFLNRKLHRSTVLPTSVPGKEVDFSSPLSDEGLSGRTAGGSGKTRVGEAEPNISLDGVFQMLKNFDKNEKDCMNKNAGKEIESFHSEDMKQMRKRKILFEDHKPSARKVLAVLGEDLKPLRSTKMKNFASKEDSRPLFNHYANGSGWWDENMTGVDNEEVGSSEAWEGVGSTILGGMEWH